MASRPKITCDKTEIVFFDTSGKRARVVNLTYDKIVSIQFDNSSVKKLFGLKTVPSKKISITVRGASNPLVLFEADEKEYWEQYKKEVSAFCKDNRVSFHNNLKA